LNTEEQNVKQRNYTPFIWGLTIFAVIIILGTNYLPRTTSNTLFGIDLTFLPLLNAILNGITFILLIGALITIKKKNITAHRRLIYVAFTLTFIFLLSYLIYHSMVASTAFGGEGVLKYIYYFILITHIILATVLIPLSLISLGRGLNMQVKKHKKIARWTMPIWLYVSLTGVIIYFLISPYY